MRELKKIRMQDIIPLQDPEMKAVRGGYYGGSGSGYYGGGSGYLPEVVVTPGQCTIVCSAEYTFTSNSCYGYQEACQYYTSGNGGCFGPSPNCD